MSEKIDWQNGQITDEGVAYMRRHIGRKRAVRPWNSQVTKDGIWHFALGLGDDNPLWWDEGYAKKAPQGRMFAPPAFLYSCMSGGRYMVEDDPSAGGVEEFLPGCLGVWANDRWHWKRPAFVGEDIVAMSELYEVREIAHSNFGGRSVAQTQRTELTSKSGDLIAEYFQTILRFDRSAARKQSRYAGHQKTVYSQSDQRRMAEQYESEAKQRRGAEPRYWTDVNVGDSLGPLLKGPLTITNLAGWLLGWGSPMCPTNRMAHAYLRQHPGALLYDDRYGLEDTLEGAHWDPYFASMSGIPDGYDFGCQRTGWASHLLTDWMGDHGFLHTLDMRLRRPNLLGDATWLTGSIKAKRQDGDNAFVDCAIEGKNQNGEINCSGTAVVRLPVRR